MDEKTPKKPAGRFQYSRKGLLLFIAWLAVFCGLVLLHLALSAIFLVLSLFIVALVSDRWQLCAWLAIVLLVGAGLLWPRDYSPETDRDNPCRENLKRISDALAEYEHEHGNFPPAYLADKNGKPMHSWRVLILPYLGYQDIYKQYRLDEPWDGPNNRKLANKCPEEFCCPSDIAVQSPTGRTSYVAIVGPHAAWMGEKGVMMTDLTDGRPNTILVVETANSGIHWMEPRDLYVGQMARTVNPKAGQGISSRHRGGAHAAFADKGVHYLRDDFLPETLNAFLTRDGSDYVDPDQWLPSQGTP